MILFRLTLLTLWARKTWVLVYLSMLLLPFALPHIAPVEELPKLVQPARAHAAWQLAWLLGIFWGLSQAARLGDGNSRTGVGNLLRSQGVGPLSQLGSLWLGLMVYLVPVALVAALICSTAAAPAYEGEKGMWYATNAQFVLLYLLAMGPLALLGIGIASRFGAMVGLMVPVALGLYGLHGVGYLGDTIKMGGNPVLEWAYIISPHYHLADLTPRLLFKMGGLAGGALGEYVVYFLVLGLVLAAGARLMFKTEPLRS
ncbi:MAG: hypothetical protein MUF31_00335 [Akkermansiaceae bacterium]|jgi:hypothetical protein|nr:hypothetical protein [Akkermansiaceae bacterium]